MNIAALARRTVVYVLLSIAAFLSVFPFYWMIVGSTNRNLTIDEIIEMKNEGRRY